MPATRSCHARLSVAACAASQVALQQRVQLGRVLGQSPVADLGDAELALDDAKGVFALGPDGVYDPSARLESISVPTIGS